MSDLNDRYDWGESDDEWVDCVCGRGRYNRAKYTSCYDCYEERRGDYVTCIECGVRWHDPNYALCYICSHSDNWRDRVERQNAAALLRREIMFRDRFRCQICHRATATQIDHIKPCRFGGDARPWNLQAVCAFCNQVKGATWWIGCKWDQRRAELMADYFFMLRGLLNDEERLALKADIEQRRSEHGHPSPVRSL